MEDVLDLSVDENEFSNEDIQVQTPQSTNGLLGGKEREHNFERETVKFSLNSDDFLTLDEAKKELLKRLQEFGEDSEQKSANKDTKFVKLPVKCRLGKRHTEGEVSEDIDMMDCDEIEPDGSQRKLACQKDTKNSFKPYCGKQNKKNSGRTQDIPRRPRMTKLCKSLRAKWHHSPEMIGKEIAERLEEPKYNLIINVVKTIGGEKALELFKETKEVQLNGGMHTTNGSRRRTSGGVYLTLLKNKFATEEEVKKIFREDSKMNVEKIKRKRTLQRQRRREKERQKKAETEMVIGQEDCKKNVKEIID